MNTEHDANTLAYELLTDSDFMAYDLLQRAFLITHDTETVTVKMPRAAWNAFWRDNPYREDTNP
jgi:hypothetical protein